MAPSRMRSGKHLTPRARACGRVATIGAAALLATITLQSQAGGTDARARALLDEMRAAYSSLEAFHIKVRWTARYSGGMSADDFPLPGPDDLELRMQRPNKLFMSASAKRDGKTWSYRVVSDGTSLWFWRSAANIYTQGKAPAALTEMARLLPDDAIGTFDGSNWDADTIMEWDLLIHETPPASSVEGSGFAITAAAQEKIGGTPVDVIRMKSADASPIPIEISLYLSAANHLIQGYRLASRGKHPETGKDFSVTMQSVYDVHDAQPRFTAADFTFTPPPGATKKGRAPSGPSLPALLACCSNAR